MSGHTDLWISYARASTDEQSDSCRQQHEANERGAGSPPAAPFDDEGVRGSTPVEQRPGFTRLLDFLRASKFGTYAVRIYDTSRLGRFLDPEEHFAVERLLRKAGARAILYTRGGYTTGRSLANTVLKGAEAHLNRAYSEKLSRDVHRGLIARAREGKRTGGFAPYGFDLLYTDHGGSPYAQLRFVPVGAGQRFVEVNGKRYRAFEKRVTYLPDGRVEVIAPEHSFIPKTKPVRSQLVPGDPRQVEAVRLIHERHAAGKGYRAIARELRDRGFPSPEGGPWSQTSVASILKNPVYAGWAVYGRRSESKYHRLEPGGVIRELAEDEVPVIRQMHVEDEGRWIKTENAHEPIVGAEEWRAANERRKKRMAERNLRGGQATAKRPYLLSGRMRCPVCGRCCVGLRQKSGKGYVTPYYVCGTNQRGGGCKRGALREEAANEAILGLLCDLLKVHLPEDRLRTIFRDALDEVMGPRAKPVESPRLRLEKDAAAVERDIAGIVNNVSPENLPLFDKRLTELRKRQEALQAALAAPEALAEPAQVIDRDAIVEQAVGLARQLRELRKCDTDEVVVALREKLLPIFVDHIIAHPEESYLEVVGTSDAPQLLAALGATQGTAEVVSRCGRGEWI